VKGDMLIDVRGLRHPEHLKEFRRHFEGLCTVQADVEVLMDNNRADLKKFEMFVLSCRGKYTVTQEGDYLRMKIEGHFSMCG